MLGICLGMQMLFEKGYEFGETDGLGLIPGCVQLIDGGGLKIPHMGWNDLTLLHQCPLSADIANGDYVYFVHSYRAETSDAYISCYTMYNEKIPALVFRDHVYGAQFHPEKSGQVGMDILKKFCKVGDYMIILPAIDIKDGKCVRLRKGEFDTAEQVAASPYDTADSFRQAGAAWIHMVDLDGAKDAKPVNSEIFL